MIGTDSDNRTIIFDTVNTFNFQNENPLCLIIATLNVRYQCYQRPLVNLLETVPGKVIPFY